MEEIPYRNTKLLVKTIPKGTVLFRLVSKKNNDELRGIPLSDGTRCISPNHNIFFYPNPFLAKEALEKLGVELTSSQFTKDYNEGRSTQVPTGRLIGVKGRISRKIGYEGTYVYYERTA